MRAIGFLFFAILHAGAACGQSSQSVNPETVEFSSGTLHLKAYLWRPSGPGPFPAVLFNHGRSSDPQQHTKKLTITAAARILGPVFAKHGYVFLFPFRRGEGLSADQGPFIGDLLEREEIASGKEARKHLQFILLTTDQFNDGFSALLYLKSLRDVDVHRLAVA